VDSKLIHWLEEAAKDEKVTAGKHRCRQIDPAALRSILIKVSKGSDLMSIMTGV
jgi:hypothetical protein